MLQKAKYKWNKIIRLPRLVDCIDLTIPLKVQLPIPGVVDNQVPYDFCWWTHSSTEEVLNFSGTTIQVLNLPNSNDFSICEVSQVERKGLGLVDKFNSTLIIVEDTPLESTFIPALKANNRCCDTIEIASSKTQSAGTKGKLCLVIDNYIISLKSKILNSLYRKVSNVAGIIRKDSKFW